MTIEESRPSLEATPGDTSDLVSPLAGLLPNVCAACGARILPTGPARQQDREAQARLAWQEMMANRKARGFR